MQPAMTGPGLGFAQFRPVSNTGEQVRQGRSAPLPTGFYRLALHIDCPVSPSAASVKMGQQKGQTRRTLHIRMQEDMNCSRSKICNIACPAFPAGFWLLASE